MLMSFFFSLRNDSENFPAENPPSPRRVFSRFVARSFRSNPIQTNHKTLTQKVLSPQNETGFRTG